MRHSKKRSDYIAVKILAFPKAGTAYTEQFYQKLEGLGATVSEGVFAGRWLLQNLWRFDTVHIHWPAFFYTGNQSKLGELIQFAKFLLFLGFVRLSGKRLCWTAHNLYPHDPCAMPGLHKVGRFAVTKLATKIFVHGSTAEKLIAKEFPWAKSKMSIIAHGNWIEYYPKSCTRECARRSLNIPENTFVYLFIGLCKEYKNIHALIDNVKYLQENSLLIVAGRFDNCDYYRRVMELAGTISGNCLRVDARFIPDEELQHFLMACDAVVLPYAESLTSGAAVLALGFGRPVVAPALGNLCDIIDDRTGVLYAAEERNGLLKAMGEIRKRKFREGQILEFAESLTWDQAVMEILDEARR